MICFRWIFKVRYRDWNY